MNLDEAWLIGRIQTDGRITKEERYTNSQKQLVGLFKKFEIKELNGPYIIRFGSGKKQKLIKLLGTFKKTSRLSRSPVTGVQIPLRA